MEAKGENGKEQEAEEAGRGIGKGCHILPVVWKMSYYHITEPVGQNQRQRACFVEFARRRHWRRSCCMSITLQFTISGQLFLVFH